MNLAVIAMFVSGYLLGSVPFGIIIGKTLYGIDPRTVGSGNIGTANSMRAFGRTGAVLVLLGDALKGAIPTYVALRLFDDPWITAGVGLATVVGHNWSMFLRFKGGKGVATTLGVVIVLSLLAAVAFGAVWLATAAITRYSSLASMLGSAAVPLMMYARGDPLPYVWYGIIALALVLWRHEPNIRRLIAGDELKIGTKKTS
ncbi:MAG TPA: glycerol-3-phosphate 1-O-acyltransferase PlsY [Candidatus Eremiobacteraceae bacterium]|nr:glycerol-3-phosphate 1-O-acyltransferase PlsY [Candidatus Eremiobacteraceae bacterium]